MKRFLQVMQRLLIFASASVDETDVVEQPGGQPTVFQTTGYRDRLVIASQRLTNIAATEKTLPIMFKASPSVFAAPPALAFLSAPWARAKERS